VRLPPGVRRPLQSFNLCQGPIPLKKALGLLRSVAARIPNGGRAITVDHAENLGARLKMDPSALPVRCRGICNSPSELLNVMVGYGLKLCHRTGLTCTPRPKAQLSMPLVIITVREELFPETYCWALQECMTEALRAAGWSAEPWLQKVVRLPPAEFVYKPCANPDGADVPNFLLVEVLLPRPRPKAEKEAFWVEFRAAVEARLPSKEPDLVLCFVELPDENLYYSRKPSSL
jgi:hypothetical protein